MSPTRSCSAVLSYALGTRACLTRAYAGNLRCVHAVGVAMADAALTLEPPDGVGEDVGAAVATVVTGDAAAGTPL